MISTGAWEIVLANPAMFAAAAMLGIVVNFLAFFVIQTTSSLMLKVGHTYSLRCVVVRLLTYPCPGRIRNQLPG